MRISATCPRRAPISGLTSDGAAAASPTRGPAMAAELESSLELSLSSSVAGPGSLSPARSRIFKIIVIGDSNVGKTCLTYRFCAGSFPERTEATIGVDFRERAVVIDGERIKVRESGGASTPLAAIPEPARLPLPRWPGLLLRVQPEGRAQLSLRSPSRSPVLLLLAAIVNFRARDRVVIPPPARVTARPPSDEHSGVSSSPAAYAPLLQCTLQRVSSCNS